MKMTRAEHESALAAWRREEEQPFTGWDFSYLNGRMSEGRPPWSYMARAADLMAEATSLVDLGTGGGERLLALKDHWPANVLATEEYPPNLALASQRLAPYGVEVVDVRLTDDDLMPFEDGRFDLVLNRHAAFNPREVARVLAPGGVFLTQQVHGLWAADLLALFGATPQWPEATPQKYVPRLEAAGLRIVAATEWRGHISFSDVGAIVYYLKAVPWLVPGFSVERHAAPLLQLRQRQLDGDELVFSARKYLIEARKEP